MIIYRVAIEFMRDFVATAAVAIGIAHGLIVTEAAPAVDDNSVMTES
jgi:hypothetical protein